MYRPQLNLRDKSGAIAAVIGVHAALLLALLHISGKIDLADPQSTIRVFDVKEVPPPPPPPPPPVRREQPQPKRKEGGSAPKNIKSEATPVVAPKPRVVVPPIPQIAAAEIPRQGTAPTQGASDVRRPGTGAGGSGNGTGSGAGGNGPGGGGDGGVALPVSLLRGISGRDYPPEVRESWPRGGIIYLRLRIEADGRPSRCDVMRSFGSPSIDQWTCSLVTQRGIFRPARNALGAPIAAWFGYKQVDIGR